MLGRHFTLRTDHGSLTWLWNFKDPEGQLACWLERLQEYNFNIVHRPGRRHGNDDGLSRLPFRQFGRESHTTVSTIRTQDLEDKDLLQKQLHGRLHRGTGTLCYGRGTETIRPVYQEWKSSMSATVWHLESTRDPSLTFVETLWTC